MLSKNTKFKKCSHKQNNLKLYLMDDFTNEKHKHDNK